MYILLEYHNIINLTPFAREHKQIKAIRKLKYKSWSPWHQCNMPTELIMVYSRDLESAKAAVNQMHPLLLPERVVSSWFGTYELAYRAMCYHEGHFYFTRKIEEEKYYELLNKILAGQYLSDGENEHDSAMNTITSIKRKAQKFDKIQNLIKEIIKD